MKNEDEQVKMCMIKWAKNFSSNIPLNEWESMESKYKNNKIGSIF